METLRVQPRKIGLCLPITELPQHAIIEKVPNNKNEFNLKNKNMYLKKLVKWCSAQTLTGCRKLHADRNVAGHAMSRNSDDHNFVVGKHNSAGV